MYTLHMQCAKIKIKLDETDMLKNKSRKMVGKYYADGNY